MTFPEKLKVSDVRPPLEFLEGYEVEIRLFVLQCLGWEAGRHHLLFTGRMVEYRSFSTTL